MSEPMALLDNTSAPTDKDDEDDDEGEDDCTLPPICE